MCDKDAFVKKKKQNKKDQGDLRDIDISTSARSRRTIQILQVNQAFFKTIAFDFIIYNVKSSERNLEFVPSFL